LQAVSGDQQGALKTWDLRRLSCTNCMYVGETRKPISHLELSEEMPQSRAAWETSAAASSSAHQPATARLFSSRLLAVNSYDNVLRLYDAPVRGGPQPDFEGCSVQGGTSPSPTRYDFVRLEALECIHRLVGHKNRHWPIKSSIFVGHDYVRGAAQRRWADSSTFDGTDETMHQSLTIHETAVVATGSTDHHAYIYDIGGPPGSGELVQRLEGHGDRVYATHFHPHEPILASCSADFTLKIWVAHVSSRRVASRSRTSIDRWHR